MEAIENNTRLNSIFAYDDPDTIANILIEEYNRIINTLAPEKVVQVTKEDLPYFNKAILELKHEADAELTKAIKGKKPEDWRNQQRLKTKLEQEIEKSKREYFGQKLEHRTNIWKVINENKSKDESTVPTEILVNGKIVNSPKKLANAFNDGYHEKTEKIRETFTETNIDPVDIMNEVIPTKNESSFEFQQTTPEEVLEIILK